MYSEYVHLARLSAAKTRQRASILSVVIVGAEAIRHLDLVSLASLIRPHAKTSAFPAHLWTVL